MKKFLSVVLVGSAIVSLHPPFSARASGPGDEHWDNQFGPAGANALVAGVAVIGQNVYVAGTAVTAAGNIKVNGAAGFDGTNWFPLSSGLMGNNAVVGINSDGNYLYVGGIFTNADDPAAIDTARWDGTNWSGIGIQGVMEVAKRDGGYLYVGGLFSTAGGVVATNIARWDGTNWFSLGLGVSGTGFGSLSSVNCMAFQGNNVYVGGNFSFSGTARMTNAAFWDGTAWNAMGNPFNGPVNALAFYGGNLFAGGAFTNNSLHFTNLARWDGSSWSPAPGGGANRFIMDFATDGTNLFVGGLFTQIGGIAATGVASFNGTKWSPVGGGVLGFQGNPGQVNRMVWQSNQLYVAGGFERAGNVGAANVARWDGTDWWSFGGKTSKGMLPSLNFSQTLLYVGGPGAVPAGLYAGGLFGEAGDVILNGIGRWDGTNWNPVGDGVSGVFPGFSGSRVSAMATNGANLYAGGSFTNAGGSYAPGVAYWDGSDWFPLGSGVDSAVNALAVDNLDLVYVGGSFTNAGGIFSRGLAVWTGAGWLNPGNVSGTNATVNALAFDGTSKIYAGGSFFAAGGISATNIAYFDNDDFSWHPVGSGFLDGKVNALACGNGTLYAGGTFTNAGGLIVKRIAQWNGSSWSGLGSGIIGSSSATVNAIAISGTDIYVTGSFTNAGGIIVSNIAKWNGSAWSALGSGLDPSRPGTGLAAAGHDIYVNGSFASAGDKPAEFIAHWNAQSNFYPVADLQLTRATWRTNRQFRFRITGTSGQSYIIQGSTNFTSWTSLTTNSTMFFDFSDTNSANFSSRFYRALLGP